MENKFLNRFKKTLKLEVIGINVDNYIKKLIKAKIPIIAIEHISYKKMYIYINYKDYLKIKKMKTIYDVKIVSRLGILKFKDILKNNFIMLIFIILSICILYFLSNVIFSIDVIHSDSKLKKLIYSELKEYGIDKYKMRKSTIELEQIEEKILNNNKDKLEWIEIVESGTKYIVRLEKRVLNKNIVNNNYQDIVASKSAILTNIVAYNGEKVKNIYDYVTKGDVIISGNMLKSDGSNIYTSAKGYVYGETWYTVNIEYPYIYKEENLTGKSKEVIVFNFLNKRFSFFDFNKFNSFEVNSKILIYNNLLPINLVKEKQYELNVIDDFLTEEEAINKSIEIAKEKLLKSQVKIKNIKNVTVIEKNSFPNKVHVKLFMSVIEDIGIEQINE